MRAGSARPRRCRSWNKEKSRAVSFLWNPWLLSGAMGANDDAGCEEAKNDHRKKEQDIAGIDHAFLDAVKMRHYAERRDRFHESLAGPLREQIRDRRPAGENEKKAEHHRNDEAHHLV